MAEDRQRGWHTASLEVPRKVVVAEGGGMMNGEEEGGKGAGRRTLSLSQVYDRLENAKLVARERYGRGRGDEEEADEKRERER